MRAYAMNEKILVTFDFKVYRCIAFDIREVWFSIFLTQFGVFCHSITPLLLYFIYDNIDRG